MSGIKSARRGHEYNHHHHHNDHHHDHHHDHDHDDHHHDHDHDDDYSNDFDMYPSEFLERFENAAIHGKIIDVREPWELEQARIAASISIPLKNLQKGLVNLGPDEVYYVICTSGIRSSYAATYMVSLGFKNVYNIQGGLNGIIECLMTRKQQPAWLLMESAESPKR